MSAGTGGALRNIRIREARSGLDVRCALLDSLAPRNAELLWQLAEHEPLMNGMHAMWTGPEISIPLDGAKLLPGFDVGAVPQENATSFPQAGDIALVCAPQGTWRDGPPFDLIDIGLFYGPGGRMLMPMGWIMASICARIADEDLAAAAAGCRIIRSNGACELRLSRA